jgi:hypothetical protein
MEFAFRETLVATIYSSPAPFRLISEKRSPLDHPKGDGRTGGVQPDHGLWSTEHSKPICRMAVEVKHYKSSAKRKFIFIFEDYARALSEADVYLVNYGPTGEAVYEVPRPLDRRCYAIEYLMPSAR